MDIDFEKAISVQCQSNIESIIREKFDSMAVRIFRLLLQKGHLEEEQVCTLCFFVWDFLMVYGIFYGVTVKGLSVLDGLQSTLSSVISGFLPYSRR